MIEILTIGTELLLGSTLDGNGAWLGQRLAEAGFEVTRRTTVPDDAAAIRDALAAALQRTGTVICTGGLGPTADDLTRPVVAALYGRDLALDEVWLERIRERFQRRGLEMPAVNAVQALVPEGARLLPNERGTAPGLLLDQPGLGSTILLPGVPGEMRALVDHHVLPWLLDRFGPRRPIVSRTLRTTGISESALGERIADLLEHTGAALPRLRGLPLTLAFLPSGIGEDLRLTCWGELDPADAAAALDTGEQRLHERVGQWVYGRNGDDLAATLGSILRDRALTLAVAESCTGGLLGQRLTDVPGASHYFLGGFLVYADHLKQKLLGVRAETLAQHGAVSETCAIELADGAAAHTGADCSISVTGVAGPGGGSPAKPVGTVWIGIRTPAGTRAQLHRLTGTRTEIRARAAQAAMVALLHELQPPDRAEQADRAHEADRADQADQADSLPDPGGARG